MGNNSVFKADKIKWSDNEIRITLGYYYFIYQKNTNKKMFEIFTKDLNEMTGNKRGKDSVGVRFANFDYANPFKTAKGFSGGGRRCVPIWHECIDENGMPYPKFISLFAGFVAFFGKMDLSIYGDFINSYPEYFGNAKNNSGSLSKTTIDRIRSFSIDRDWDQFHSPANLAKSISIEANELLECFQWSDDKYDLQNVKEELADVIVYCQDMLDKLGLDADEIVNAKMDQNEAKYPVDKAKGKADKYTKL